MSPLMSNTASGFPPFASTFAFISSSRTFVSPSRSAQLKRMLIAMPPSTPALIRPRSSPAPTAISACSVATGVAFPFASFVGKNRPSNSAAGSFEPRNSVRPFVSYPTRSAIVAPIPPPKVPTSGPMIGNDCR